MHARIHRALPFTGVAPAHFSKRFDRLYGLCGMRTGRGPVPDSTSYALKYGCKPEEIEREVKIPVRYYIIASRAPTILAKIGLLVRYSQFREVLARQPDRADADLRHLPRHQVVREVGQRVTNRGQLPIKDRDHTRLSRMHNHIVEAKVAVHIGVDGTVKVPGRSPLS